MRLTRTGRRCPPFCPHPLTNRNVGHMVVGRSPCPPAPAGQQTASNSGRSKISAISARCRYFTEAPAQKKPFVGGAGTYEGRQGEGAHPSRTTIIGSAFRNLNPSNGGNPKKIFARSPKCTGPSVLPCVRRPEAQVPGRLAAKPSTCIRGLVTSAPPLTGGKWRSLRLVGAELRRCQLADGATQSGTVLRTAHNSMENPHTRWEPPYKAR